MSIWSRLRNVFRGERLNRELDEEMASHLEEAEERGRHSAEARRAFGEPLRWREQSRDIKLAVWLDALRADIVFGWRQLWKNKTVSGAAVISLALAIGACVSAFRLIDAALLRPLPVAGAERLYCLFYQYVDGAGKPDTGDSFEYPMFRLLRATGKGQAELLAISYSGQVDLTYGSDQEMEKAYRQYVSGWTFSTFGLKPALGRLLTAADDEKPGQHPYAVLSYDYWTRRFGRDPAVLGRTFRQGTYQYEIVGVIQPGFWGTETGTMTDVYVPTMMNARAINEKNWSWFRTWVSLSPGEEPEPLRQKLQSTLKAFREERVKGFPEGTPRERIEQYVNAPLFLQPAAAGVSGLQKKYRESLGILAVVVGLVLLIACVNVANLMTAQAAARAREMALRVSIGAGRWRLVQLVLVESAMVALAASALGGMFAWWSAPFVVNMINPPDNPARLVLPADWRVLGFAVSLGLLVTMLFGLAPALRASEVKPVSALKGGEDPHAKRRLMHALIAAQVTFCFLVHFVAGLFVATFDRLANQPVGFTPEGLLTLETAARTEQAKGSWEDVLRQVRATPGVESAALSGWALMSGNGWSSGVFAGGKSPDGGNEPYFLGVSRGWLSTMEIPMIAGRDFRDDDLDPRVAIVNEEFAKKYFDGRNPVGESLETVEGRDKRVRREIVGYVKNARYRNMREAIRPTIYVPCFRLDQKGELRKTEWGTVVVRVASGGGKGRGDLMSLAPALRKAVVNARPEFRVSNVRTQEQLVRSHVVRERLLAMLSLFFATVALVLAGIGLYGVLNYSVVQRRREISIRMALGAQPGDVAKRVTTEVFGMLALGSLTGLILGALSERYFENILYQVKTTDLSVLVIPALTVFLAGVAAAIPPVIAAVRTDPAVILRGE